MKWLALLDFITMIVAGKKRRHNGIFSSLIEIMAMQKKRLLRLQSVSLTEKYQNLLKAPGLINSESTA